MPFIVVVVMLYDITTVEVLVSKPFPSEEFAVKI